MRAGVPAFRVREAVFETLPALAVTLAVWVVVTPAMLALNVALLEEAAMVTEAGTVTALLLLARVTAVPPLGATAARVTVQESVAAPVKDEVAQERLLRAGEVCAPAEASL